MPSDVNAAEQGAPDVSIVSIVAISSFFYGKVTIFYVKKHSLTAIFCNFARSKVGRALLP